MYKIVNITDKNGNRKDNFYKELSNTHPDMIGMPPENIKVGSSLLFFWDDDTTKILKTSPVTNRKINRESIVVETENSIYYLQKVE